MTFAGVPVYAPVLEYPAQTNAAIMNVSGLSLGPFVAFPPVAANPDVGQLTSNNGAIDPVPPGALSWPTIAGPGADDWSQSDVDALNAQIQAVGMFPAVLGAVAILVPNVNPAPAGSNIANANAQITVQNKAGVPADALAIRIQAAHSIALAARG